jgi:predicted anti-sigma-YlaC factor YlaD
MRGLDYDTVYKDEGKMKICKHTLREIAIYGTAVSEEAKAHLSVCESCAAVYKEEAELENVLLSAQGCEPPPQLKYAILEAVDKRRREPFAFPALGYLLKAAVLLIIIVSGFWLGLQTANSINGINDISQVQQDIDITRTAVYMLNTEPVNPGTLDEIYFAVLREAENEK